MATISVSKLKTYLSAELKRVESGVELTVVDHKRPVAKLSPIHGDAFFVREATCRYEYESLSALITADPLQFLEKVLAGIALATPLLVED